MAVTRVPAIALLLAASAVVGYGQSSPVNRPWPPPLQTVSDESPALSPAEALKTFYMPPGYRLELVASEPLVEDPTVIDWDLQGRLWVVEMTGFFRDLDAPEPNLDPTGRVVVLEDTNRDGRMDKRTVFADGLVLPRALKVLDRGVLVGEPGALWWMRDTNGDLRADTKEIVTKDYGRRLGSVEGNANGLLWSLDNWIQTSGADVYLRLKNGTFEVRKTLLRGEWGVTEDDAGRIYRNTNESALHVDLVPTPYFSRNPVLMRTRGSYESFAAATEDVNTIWPVRPNPGTNRAYQVGIDRPDGTLAKFSAVCAPMVYRGDRLPADLYGNVFVAEPSANLVSRLVITDDGTSLRAKKAYEKGEFLASTDERFRPVYVSNGPDGTLYIVDMYRGVIQDRSSTTLYLRDYIKRKKLDAPIGLGRIYRVMHDTTTLPARPSLATAPPARIVDELSSPNGWRRETAQRLLVERGETSQVDRLMTMASDAPDWRTRLRALWTLDGLDRIEPGVVIRALQDRSRDVRASALRLSERWLSEPNHPIKAAVLERLDESDWFVREQLAATLGTLPPGEKEPALVAFLDRAAGDPVAVDAALSGLRGSETKMLELLLASPGAETSQRATAITMVTALVLRSASDPAAQTALASAADAQRPLWQRTAVLRGAEVVLTGATLPGTPTRRGGPPPAAAAPCPTCPGGRAGPGGAYAFPGVREAQAAAAGTPITTGRGAGPILRVSHEPVEFSALAASGEFAARAAAVLARIEWPGKPGAREALTPLTADEQTRFNAGRETYRNICQACHQPDGRGQDKLAPSLVGSPLALAAPDVPLRILLNGKEGPVGLMPALGASLSDADVAGVLTYIRREWGQTGSPVAPDAVAAARAAHAARQRPWTDDELLKLAGIDAAK